MSHEHFDPGAPVVEPEEQAAVQEEKIPISQQLSDQEWEELNKKDPDDYRRGQY